jgi:hypothetical protein
MFIKSVLFLLCAVGAYTQGIDNKLCVGKPDGTFLKHPDNTKCQEYVSCFKGVAYERKCPDGFFHDKCKQTECNFLESLTADCRCEGAAPPSSCPKEGEISLGNIRRLGLPDRYYRLKDTSFFIRSWLIFFSQ